LRRRRAGGDSSAGGRPGQEADPPRLRQGQDKNGPGAGMLGQELANDRSLGRVPHRDGPVTAHPLAEDPLQLLLALPGWAEVPAGEELAGVGSRTLELAVVHTRWIEGDLARLLGARFSNELSGDGRERVPACREERIEHWAPALRVCLGRRALPPPGQQSSAA